MKSTKSFLKTLAGVTASFAFVGSASAAIVYDNASTSASPSSYIAKEGATIVEFGDQIVLSGSERNLQDFKFEYFLGLNASGNETARLRLYKNDGQNGAPSTVMYDSDVFSITSGVNGYGTVTAPVGVTGAPTTFTWSILFGGVEAGENAGLVLNDTPTVGSSIYDFWQKSVGGSWGTVSIDSGATPANFAARVTAVPEPTTVALLVSGLALVGAAKLRRRK